MCVKILRALGFCFKEYTKMRAPTKDFSECLGEFLTSDRSHLWLTRVLRSPVVELCGVVPAGRMYLRKPVFCFRDATGIKSTPHYLLYRLYVIF